MASEETMTALTVALATTTNNRDSNTRLEACPTRSKEWLLRTWLSEVEVVLWDSSNTTGEPAELNTKKYLTVMASIRNAEDKDLEKTAEVEFMENQESNKKTDIVMSATTKKSKEKQEKFEVETCSAVREESVKIKQEGNEAMKDYTAGFRQTKIEKSVKEMKNNTTVEDRGR